MQYDDQLYNALSSYYTILSNIGYYNESVNNLLVVDFINTFIENCYSFITDEDIQLINSIIPCLNDCLLQIPLLNTSLRKLTTKDDIITLNKVRRHEINDLKLTEKIDYRETE